MLLDNDTGDKKRKDILGQNECNFINLGEEDEMEIYGYEKSALSTAIMWVVVIMTLGLFRLLLHWRPEWMLYISHRRCPLEKADKVLVVDTYEKRFKSLFIRDVKTLSISGFNEGKRGNQVPVNQEVDKRCLEAHLNNGSSKVITSVQAIWVKKLCYIWDDERKSFMKLVGLDRGQTRAQLHSYNGFSKENQLLRSILYGRNEIFVQIQSIKSLIVLEVLNPFYIFQVFTICVWLAEYYYYYCFAIIFMSLFGISSAVIQTRQNQKNLHKTVHSSGTITVCRGSNEYEEIPTTDLVPGDVIVIPSQGCVMHCDAVLLVGSCIVNESMLTGESVPVMKTALQNEQSLYNEKEDSNHTLFCGTRVLQIKNHGKGKVHAVVLRTGFLTAKGNLVRSILYPPPADYKFDSQTYKFIWILAAIALLGLIYTVVTKSSRGLQPIDILIKALDIITIVVPPSLPAAMTVGKLYALSRLKKQKISCINSRVINVSGSINCICFDKTGTLTEDGLDMWGVVPAQRGQFAAPLNDTSQLPNGPLLYGMASCHSLTMINGVLSGDPLDVKMMESTKWIYQEIDEADTMSITYTPAHAIVKPPGDSPNNNMEIALIHQFQFSSTLQRMSIVTKAGGSDDLVVYCKGSPEMIQSLSLPDSVPENLPSILQTYTEQGYRVIALGERKLKDIDHSKLQTMHRNDLEKDLNFCGLIILENRLKPKTISIIDVLKKAQMKIVMVTGDNILTAVSVAKECGIISSNEAVIEVVAEVEDMKAKPTISFINSMSPIVPVRASVPNISGKHIDYELGLSMVNSPNYRLAVTGKSWEIIREMRPDLIPKLCVRGAVFARMSSDQKQQLIQDLQQLGYFVAMCGDGANDCGALKAAHTGISLSEAESSVASPFTSQIADISCVPRVIQECRAALVTSFGVFKFMVLYSLTEFLSTIILYSIDSNLTQNQFLFIDICLSLNFAISFGRNPAYSGQLVAAVPLTSVFSAIALTSITSQVVIMFAFQCLSFYVVHLYSWFTPFHYIAPTYYKCYENYAVYSLSQFQYIILAFIFSQGAPYREPIYRNKIFFSAILGMTIVCSYITLHPAEWVKDLLELEFPKQFDFPPMVLLLVGINFLFSLFFENVVVQYIMFKKLRRWRHNIDKSSKKYLAVERDLKTDRHFPLFKSFINKNDKINVSNVSEIGLPSNSDHHTMPESGHVNLAFSVDEDQSRFSTKF